MLTALLLVVMGCRHVEPELVEPSQIRKIELGKSVQGTPIVMTRIGDAPRPVFIMAAIHGDEVTTAPVAQRLLALIEANPRLLNGKSVTILPVANPDGYAAKTRSNAHGVDLNRNFPAKNWKGSIGRRNYGTKPLSEPESRAILSAMDTLKPSLIISMHSIERGRHCNNFDGPAKRIAELMNTHNHYPVTETMGYPTPGSLGSYAGIDRGIPIITLELPRNASADEAWDQNREALLRAISEAK